jgi:hypothetical protein
MAQVRQVVSETLQATIRRLLPSQQGFTEDLQASNVITPIIDLTPSAEGSGLPVDLSRALALGSQTAFDVNNTTSTLINNTGFYRVFGGVSVRGQNTLASEAFFSLTDGTTTKKIYEIGTFASSDTYGVVINVDFIVFLNTGESLTATSNNTVTSLIGSTRQVADINGNLVNPDGFTAS